MRDGLLAAILLCAYGWLFVFSARINNPNEFVRIYAARALVEQHRWSFAQRARVGNRFIDTGPIAQSWGYVNDKALVCDDPAAHAPNCAGLVYAGKAPAASLLAAPIVWLLERFEKVPDKTHAVLLLRWLWVILPSVAFWLLLRRALERKGASPETALFVTLAGALGSLSLTYGQMFAGHQLAALALGFAWLCAFDRDQPLWTGFFAALAVALEYPCAPAALLLCAGYLTTRFNKRTVMLGVLGALPWALVLAQFHWSAFGAPWATPYGHLENPDFVRDIAPGFMGISLPTLERLYGSLFAPWLGLFYWAPWLLLLFLGTRRTAPALTALAICGYYLVFQITHALWRSGWVIGPRYITPLVPFAAIALALRPRAAEDGAAQRAFAPDGIQRDVAESDAARASGWRARLAGFERAWLCGAGAAGIAATGLASSVCQGFPLEVINPLRQVVAPLLSHGYVSRNLLQAIGVPGLWSAIPYFAALLAGIALLLWRKPLALAIFLALTCAQWLAPSNDDRGAAHFFADQWEPQRPPGSTPF